MSLTRRAAIGSATAIGLAGAFEKSEARPSRLGDASVSLFDFGAVCDGIADDSEAVQRAVHHCGVASYPTKLIVPGRTRLTRSINIDRPVDRTVGDFIIEGRGPGAGLFVDRPVTMFSSTLSGGRFGLQSSPSSEYIVFRDLLFEASVPSITAFVVSDRLFRYRVEGCTIHRIKWLERADYVQSCYFTDCNVRGWEGTFFSAADGYDVSVRGCAFEAGGAGFRFRGALTKFVAFGEIFEGCSGTFIAISGVNALTICGMYFEENGASEIVLGENYGVSRAVNIIGCSFNLPERRSAEFPIKLGLSYAVNVTGNYSNGRIADNEGVFPWNFNDGLNFTPSAVDPYKVDPRRDNQSAAHGTQQKDAFEIRRAHTRFTHVTDTANAARLPMMSAVRAMGALVVINATGQPLRLFPAVGERFVGRQLNAVFIVPPGGRLELQPDEPGVWIALARAVAD